MNSTRDAGGQSHDDAWVLRATVVVYAARVRGVDCLPYVD